MTNVEAKLAELQRLVLEWEDFGRIICEFMEAVKAGGNPNKADYAARVPEHLRDDALNHLDFVSNLLALNKEWRERRRDMPFLLRIRLAQAFEGFEEIIRQDREIGDLFRCFIQGRLSQKKESG